MLEIIKQELKLLKDINYYGSKNQIENENLIVKESKIEMEYNESIEEYYIRILKELK